MDKLTKDALHKMLQNVTGKSIADKHYETTLDVLNAYNALYECTVTFALTPSTATVVVKQAGVVVPANEDETYNLVADTYSYTISAEGYVTQTDVELVVNSGDATTGTKTVATVLVAS